MYYVLNKQVIEKCLSTRPSQCACHIQNCPTSLQGAHGTVGFDEYELFEKMSCKKSNVTKLFMDNQNLDADFELV